METIQQDTSNKVIQKEVVQKEGFDEQTKLHFQSLLEEIDRKQQTSYQSTASDGKTSTSSLRLIRNVRSCHSQAKLAS